MFKKTTVITMLALLLVTWLICGAAPQKEAVQAYNPHNLYYEQDFKIQLP